MVVRQLLGMVCGAFVLAGCQAAPSAPWDAARALHADTVETADVPAVRAALESHLASSPDDVEALYRLACCQMWKTDPDLAIANLTKALALRPTDARFYCALAQAKLLFAFGPEEDIRELFTQALAMDPGLVPAEMGLAHLKARQWGHDAFSDREKQVIAPLLGCDYIPYMPALALMAREAPGEEVAQALIGIAGTRGNASPREHRCVFFLLQHIRFDRPFHEVRSVLGQQIRAGVKNPDLRATLLASVAFPHESEGRDSLPISISPDQLRMAAEAASQAPQNAVAQCVNVCLAAVAGQTAALEPQFGRAQAALDHWATNPGRKPLQLSFNRFWALVEPPLDTFFEDCYPAGAEGGPEAEDQQWQGMLDGARVLSLLQAGKEQDALAALGPDNAEAGVLSTGRYAMRDEIVHAGLDALSQRGEHWKPLLQRVDGRLRQSEDWDTTKQRVEELKRAADGTSHAAFKEAAGRFAKATGRPVIIATIAMEQDSPTPVPIPESVLAGANLTSHYSIGGNSGGGRGGWSDHCSKTGHCFRVLDNRHAVRGEMTYRCPGYRELAIDICLRGRLVGDGGVHVLRKLTEPDWCTVTGRVATADGRPLAGVSVSIPYHTSAKAVQTGSDGSFRMTRIEPGRRTWSVEQDGYVQSWASRELEPGQSKDLGVITLYPTQCVWLTYVHQPSGNKEFAGPGLVAGRMLLASDGSVVRQTDAGLPPKFNNVTCQTGNEWSFWSTNIRVRGVPFEAILNAGDYPEPKWQPTPLAEGAIFIERASTYSVGEEKDVGYTKYMVGKKCLKLDFMGATGPASKPTGSTQP